MHQRRILFGTTVAITLIMAPAAASELGPQGVSPGAPDRLARINSACPTFSWEATPDAERYELVVYRLDAAAESLASIELDSENEVLYTTVSGRATGWTPESSECFLAGERYVWFVRAVTETETAEGSEWSEPRFFEVAAAPTVQELERAIGVIRRWEAVGGHGSLTLPADAVADAATVPAAAADSGAGAGGGAGANRTKSVITGTAAIRGEQPDPSGETYGVVGTSASPDGAGIGASNTAGGPHLVLDGAVPTEMTEAGINRPSASSQTFSFSNTGGGGMTVDVDGNEVVTTATDQDTLGTLSPCGAYQIPKWNGSIWSCMPDDDTLVRLGPCAAGEVAKWTGTNWDCSPDKDTLDALGCASDEIAKWSGSSWMCAPDENTTYSFGPGLILDGGQIRIDPTAIHPSVVVLEVGGDVGKATSMAIGADGLGLVSYIDDTDPLNGILKIARCNDAICSNPTITTLDHTGPTTLHGYFSLDTSLAVLDGRGLVSYIDGTNWDLKVAYCDNTNCTSATIATIDSSARVQVGTSIAIGADGLGIISYHDSNSPGHLRVAHCDNAACSSATTGFLDSGHGVGSHSSIAVGADGLGLISYWDVDNGDLKIAHCDDIPCTTATINRLDTAGNVGESPSIAIGQDGRGIISYYAATNGDLKVAHCDDANCSSATISRLAPFGYHSSVTIAADGLGLISYHNQSDNDLMVAHCLDVACTHAAIKAVDSAGDVGSWSSIAIGSDGLGLISYHDETHGDLKIAHLPIGY